MDFRHPRDKAISSLIDSLLSLTLTKLFRILKFSKRAVNRNLESYISKNFHQC